MVKHLIYFILIILTSCKQDDSLSNRLCTYFKDSEIEFDKSLKHCIIIPGGGCEGCIAAGIHEITSNNKYFNKNQSENLVIFTSVSSKKLLKRQIPSEIFDNLNMIIDDENIFLSKEKENIYPTILYLEGGKIIDVAIQSPNQNGFRDLLETLRNKL